MEYETAKELKDNGFPHKGNGQYIGNVGNINHDAIKPGEVFGIAQEDFCYIPTLEELIEACGYRFGSLTQSPRKTWYVTTVEGKDNYTYELVRDIECSIPLEAVARLWLALNKK